MDTEQSETPISIFEFGGQKQPVSFVETVQVTEGVECDTYRFVEDPTKDLGIIRIKPGSKTPLQRVLEGERTIEGYISGKGKFTLAKVDNTEDVYEVGESNQEPFSVTVGIGETMQWEADPNSSLKVYEVCYPPYKNGRYQDVSQKQKPATQA